MHLDDYHNTPISPHEVPGSTPRVGLCPTCQHVSDSFRIGVQTWHFCDPCETAWHTSSSRVGDETTETDWSANRRKLDRYRIVQPTPSSLTRLIHETMIAKGQMTRR